MRRPMLNNSDPGQAVYEPFLGSGTTLMAAQSTGRVCYGVEIDPLFVDVAIRRWQAFTGEKARRLNDGQTFDLAEQHMSPSDESARPSIETTVT
jgi:DNA modification methylase